MSRRYKVGEKVRLTDKGAEYLHSYPRVTNKEQFKRGTTGTVVKTSGNLKVRFDVPDNPHNGFLEDEPLGWYMDGRWIEPIPTINVGDKVRVLPTELPGGYTYEGRPGAEGVVRQVNSPGERQITVELTKAGNGASLPAQPGSRTRGYRPEVLEVIEPAAKRRFNVGDRVRVTVTPNAYLGEGWPRAGDTGVVTGHVAGFNVVRLDNPTRPKNSVGDDGWRFLDEELEPAPKFTVGMKVQLTEAGVRHLSSYVHIDKSNLRVGLTGTITDKCGYGAMKWTVRLDTERYQTNGSADGWFVYEADIEPYVEPAPVTKPEEKSTLTYKIGDRVKVVNDEMSGKSGHYVGQTGTVILTGPMGCRFPYTVEFADGGTMIYNDKELEPIDPPAYKIGDHVRLVTDNFTGRVEKGEVGVVTGFLGDIYAIVRFDGARKPTNGSENGWIVHYSSIELVPAPTFKVDDFVRLTQKGAGEIAVPWAPEGTLGRVTWIRREDDGSVRYDVRLFNDPVDDSPWCNMSEDMSEDDIEPAFTPEFARELSALIDAAKKNGTTDTQINEILETAATVERTTTDTTMRHYLRASLHKARGTVPVAA